MTMIYPMLAMVAFVFVVMAITFVIRVRSIRAGEVKLSWFEHYQGPLGSVPVINSTRHFSNLFEMPVLFFAACLTCMHLSYDSLVVVVLGWLYVIFRIVHAWIHLTYNNVMHRLAAFMKSNACLLAIWVLVAVKVIHGS